MPVLERISLPAGSERYLALQRTAYQHPINRVFRQLRLGKLYDRYVLPTLEGMRSSTLAEAYVHDLEDEYRSLADALPNGVSELLDIGCGLAGIDLYLYRHYGSQVQLNLLDRDGTSDVYYGFNPQGAFYNSLSAARSLLQDNGVAGSHVHTYEVTRDGFPGQKQFQLVLSLISWGFHYPVSTYAEQVAAALAPGGCLIIDVRHGTSGQSELETVLDATASVIKRDGKYARLKLIKGSRSGAVSR